MNFKGQAALVVGASRGFGRGIVESLVASGMTVTAVARNRTSLEDLAQDTSATIVVADATDQEAERILSETKPNLKRRYDVGPSATARAQLGDIFETVGG